MPDMRFYFGPESGLPSGSSPGIVVEYTDMSESRLKEEPDFIVRKNGTVLVRNGFDMLSRPQVTVHIEREAGEYGPPTGAQQMAADRLVSSLSARFAEVHDLPKVDMRDGRRIERVDISDRQNLISDEVERRFGNGLPVAELAGERLLPEIPPTMQDLSDRVERVRGSGASRRFSRDEIDSRFPTREVPQPEYESNGVAGVKDAIASIVRGRYDSFQKRSDGSLGVGRYGISTILIGDWLEDLLDIDLGDPPDPKRLKALLKNNARLRSKLAKAMQHMASGGRDGKEGAIPQEFADRFAVLPDSSFKEQSFVDGFLDFAGRLKGGTVSGAEVTKFMPAALQERIVMEELRDFAGELGIKDTVRMAGGDSARLALAVFLGHAPSESDLSDAANKRYMRSFENLYEVAKARISGLGDIDVKDVKGRILAAASGDVGNQVWARSDFSRRTRDGRLGCAASVSEVLQKAGFSYANSPGVGVLTDQLKEHGWKQMPVSEARPGDVVYGWKPGTKMHRGGGVAHVGIVGKNDTVYDNSSRSREWSHRRLTSVFSRRTYGDQLYVLRPPTA